MNDVKCKAVVVAADSHAAQAGAEILRRGGNAVDAAVTAVLVECVVQPHNVGIGGYAGTACLYLANQRNVVAVDFDSRAPAAATPGTFASAFEETGWRPELHDTAYPGGRNRKGYLCVTAPPVLAGLEFLLNHFGSISFADAAKAAQDIAERGFVVYPRLAAALTEYAKQADDASVAALLPDRKVPREGETFVQTDLAALISRLRHDGPRSFYEGPIRRTIVKAVRDNGGILSEEDFDAVKACLHPVVSITCSSTTDGLSGESSIRTIYTPGPPSGGLTSLQIVKLAERAGSHIAEPGSPTHYRALIEAARYAWQDRYDYLGDPLYLDASPDRLLSDAHVDAIINRMRASADTHPTAGNPAGSEHTVHLVAADENRNLVSITCTHGSSFGAMVAIPGLGLVLGNGMSRFDPVPGRANSIAPGKRMLHNMAPLIIMRGEEPHCAIGLPGGRRIVNVAALLARSIARFGLSCGQAIDLPRFHLEGPGPALVDDEATVLKMRKEFGSDYPVSVSNQRLGGPVAGVMLSDDGKSFLAASEHGSECVGALRTPV